MQIIDRYLESVKNCLPKPQADDIIKELSENISSQIEDKESELGRNLTEIEVEGILKQHGHPLVVASRYRQEQRSVTFGGQIIGPALFPFYLRVLKFNLGLTSVVVVVIFAALFTAGQRVGSLPQVLLYQVLIQFIAVTLIFWAMDKHFARFPDRWNPRKVYGFGHPGLCVPEDGPRIPRAKSISQMIGLLVGLVWLRVAQHAPILVFGPGAAFLDVSPAWHRLYVPFVALILFGIVHAGVNVVRPDWVRFHRWMKIISRVGGLGLCFFVLRVSNLVTARNGADASAQHAADIVNQTILYSILFTIALSVFRLIKDVRNLLGSSPRNGLMAPQSVSKS